MKTKNIGYIRVSTDTQNLEQQKHSILNYAQKNKVIVDEFIEVQVSSRGDNKQRKIEELLSKINKGDNLIVTELSRLGRNMLETLNLIDTLNKNDISVIFINQPELSTTLANGKLLLAIYSYFAETEREYISMRTKVGLEAAKAKGVILGRPKGTKNKKPRILDPHKETIASFLKLGVSINAIMKIVNQSLEKPITYMSYVHYINHHVKNK